LHHDILKRKPQAVPLSCGSILVLIIKLPIISIVAEYWQIIFEAAILPAAG
jgi:hypothetical protein